MAIRNTHGKHLLSVQLPASSSKLNRLTPEQPQKGGTHNW